MCIDKIKGRCNRVIGKAQQLWGEITSNDFLMINGRKIELIGLLQEHSKEE